MVLEPEVAARVRDLQGPWTYGGRIHAQGLVEGRLACRQPMQETFVMQKSYQYTHFLKEKTFVIPEEDSIFFGAHKSRYMFAAPFARGKRVLDIGYGSGYGAAYLAEGASRVIGIDASEMAAATAAGSYQGDGVRFLIMDARHMGFTRESFDLVTCFEFVEHIDAELLDGILQGIVACLKGDGLAMFSTPNIDVVLKAKTPVPDCHINNMNYKQFKALLQRHFGRVDMWGQRLRGNSVYTLVRGLDIFDLRYRLFRALDQGGKQRAYALLGVEAGRPHAPEDHVFSRHFARSAGMLLACCRK